MALIPPTPPADTPEYTSLTSGEGLEPLRRLGEDLHSAVGGDDQKDARRNKDLPRELAGLVLLRAQGFDNHEIAEKLRISPAKLRRLIAKARKEYGWDDLGHKLADVALPIAVDNVIKHLDYEGTDAGVAEGRDSMTRAVTQGLGALKHHAAVKTETKKTDIRVLRIEIAMPELPAGDQGMALADGAVLATPRRALLPSPHPTLPASSSIVEGEVLHG